MLTRFANISFIQQLIVQVSSLDSLKTQKGYFYFILDKLI
jgi:hypothetical protein